MPDCVFFLGNFNGWRKNVLQTAARATLCVLARPHHPNYPIVAFHPYVGVTVVYERLLRIFRELCPPRRYA